MACVQLCMQAHPWCQSLPAGVLGLRDRRLVVPAEGPDPTQGMTARQKQLWELQQRLKVSRKANADAVVAERRQQVGRHGSPVPCPVTASGACWHAMTNWQDGALLLASHARADASRGSLHPRQYGLFGEALACPPRCKLPHRQAALCARQQCGAGWLATSLLECMCNRQGQRERKLPLTGVNGLRRRLAGRRRTWLAWA